MIKSEILTHAFDLNVNSSYIFRFHLRRRGTGAFIEAITFLTETPYVLGLEVFMYSVTLAIKKFKDFY